MKKIFLWNKTNSKNNLEKGQHFLVDKLVLKKEIENSSLSKKDKIIEIGAGEGMLTNELAKKAKKVLSFEIDIQYKKKLELIKNKYKNLEIIYGDATKYSWEGYDKIVSNIPYYLGEKIIAKAVITDIPFIVFIIGENFKNLLIDNSTKSGIIANLFYDIKIIEKVKKSSFSPPPRVNSWLLKLTMKTGDKYNESIKFILKRKGKIKNAIISFFVNEGYTKNEAKTLLKEFHLNDKTLEKKVSNISGKMILIIYDKIKLIIKK